MDERIRACDAVPAFPLYTYKQENIAFIGSCHYGPLSQICELPKPERPSAIGILPLVSSQPSTG